MKTILVLTDFSIRAGYAAEFALQIAINTKADILLCHALELNLTAGSAPEFSWPVADHLLLKKETIVELKEQQKHLQDMLLQNQEAFKPLITYTTDYGHLAQTAENLISVNKIDLVVMGSHKSTGLTRFLLGSHTHTVLDKLNCPVLLVPESLQFKGIKNIVYATDLTFNNDKVIQYLRQLAKPFHAKITVNHISPLAPAPGDAKEEDSILSNEHSTQDTPVYYHYVKSNNVKNSLLDIAGRGLTDVLTLVHKRYDFFQSLIHNSLSKQLADNATVPLLVLPYSFSLDENAITNEELDLFCFDAGNLR
ncbi:MAG TPA: universal stress protein [Pedobacter sp.]|jgi:nucleotide-binding universal stress UspA family protein